LPSLPSVVPSELTPTTLKWYVVFGLRFNKKDRPADGDALGCRSRRSR